MEFTKQDLAHIANLMKALGKGEFKLDGNEVLALGEVFRWVAKLHQSIAAEVQVAEQKAKEAAENADKMKVVEPKNVVQETSKSRKAKHE